MGFHVHLKALAFGAVVFVVGQLLAGGLLLLIPSSSNGTSTGNAAWLLVSLASYAAPTAAGATAAYFASTSRTIHGVATVAGCSVLMTMMAHGSSSAAALTVGFYMVLGLVGAIIGSYLGRRRRA